MGCLHSSLSTVICTCGHTSRASSHNLCYTPGQEAFSSLSLSSSPAAWYAHSCRIYASLSSCNLTFLHLHDTFCCVNDHTAGKRNALVLYMADYGLPCDKAEHRNDHKAILPDSHGRIRQMSQISTPRCWRVQMVVYLDVGDSAKEWSS